jgi:hypothetical protein
MVQGYVEDATSYFFVLSLAQYVVLAWQLGFPLFAWRQHWRYIPPGFDEGVWARLVRYVRMQRWGTVLLGGAALGWVGSILIYRQPLFGPLFCIGCLSYLTPAEWRRLTSLVGAAANLPGHVRHLLAATETPARVATKA